MIRLAIACSILLLTGCASLDGMLSNRVSCTVDGSLAIYASMYGPIGIASKVDEADSEAICAGGR